MITLEQLRAWGADTDEALPRCLNNEAFYLRLVDKAVREPSFDRLREAIEAGDLGKAFDQALADRKGVVRYGSTILPMDESLILSAVDLSGRGLLAYDLQILTEKVGTFDTELTEEFFRALAHNARCTLHLKQLAGKNSHHIIEGAFKSAARSLRAAVKIDPECAGEIPSTKGVL